MAKLKSEFLYPAHLPPIEKTDIPRITEEALLSQSHFETTVMETLINYGKARLDTLVSKIRQTLNIEWQTPFRELEVDETTLLVYLNGMIKSGSVRFDEKSKYYSFVEVEGDGKGDPHG